MFFNHGLTPEELYTNTRKCVIDRKWQWFRDRYGTSSSYEDAIAGPFKYCISLIFNYILDNRVRFVIPGVPESYIDFEIVTGDFFEKHRQNGRFQNIDFIESDFTGYALRYYFKTKAYQRTFPIYLGGDLKKKFINNINSGTKYYTIKDVTLKDFLPEVEKKYSELTKTEVKKLVTQGFRRMHSSIKYGCAISIQLKKSPNCIVYIGMIWANPERQIKEYTRRMDKKLRKIDRWIRPEFDGYYYIGLNNSAFAKWIDVNRKSRSILHFTRISPRRIKEEIYYKDKHVYIFRFKRKTFKGYSYWAEKLDLHKVEYLGESLDRKFIPSTLTWQQLIKEYEKRKC